MPSLAKLQKQAALKSPAWARRWDQRLTTLINTEDQEDAELDALLRLRPGKRSSEPTN